MLRLSDEGGQDEEGRLRETHDTQRTGRRYMSSIEPLAADPRAVPATVDGAMWERVQLLGGRFEAGRSPGEGRQMRADVPLRAGR